MEITIPPDVENLVNRGVASGAFRSKEEAVVTALRLLLDDGSYYAAQRKALLDDLHAASAQIERGEYTQYASGSELAEAIIARGRAVQAKLSNGQE